jgi:serine/threonine protein kinase
MNQICCLNPECNNPSVPEHTKFCSSCGVPLIKLRNRYRPIKSLGSGGFGKTYLAEDGDKLNEKCVIKQFAPQIQGTAGLKKATELFLQEAQQLQQLGEHSQIPTLLAYFEENSRLYLVQQFIDGENLLEELEKQGIFSESKIHALLQDLLTTLKVVHEYDVIHRDIKPENIMRRRDDGKLILIDFGAAKQLQGTVRTGTRIGTPVYASLEQMRHGKAYPASDLYSLGVTCFHLLTGDEFRDVFEDWSQHSKQLGSEESGEILAKLLQISKKLGEILTKLLQEEYQQRYQSAEEVLQDLNTTQLTTKKANQSSRKSSQVTSRQQTSSTQIQSKQNSVVPKSRISQPNNSSRIIMWSSIGVFVLGIVFLGTQSAHIPTICKSLNNCAVDEKFSLQYPEVRDIAITAQKLSENAKNVEELQASEQQLKNAIAQLKTIPPSAKVYDNAKKELSDYQSQLTKIQSRLDKENQALKSINEAEQQAKEADGLKGKAQTVSEYEAVKDKLQQAIATLNDIPSDTFISERVTNLKETYQSKRQEVAKIIAKIIEPKPSPTPTPTVTVPSIPPSEETPSQNPTSTPTINKSRREYVCKLLGIDQGVRLEPSISGSKTRDWDCFVPISSGRCVARGGGNPYETVGPSGLGSCDGDSITIEDPATGEKYYQFNAVYGSVRFVLEK